MKLINRLLLIAFLLCTALSVLIYQGFTNEVGNITANSKIDNPNFKTKGHIYQYYQSGAKYKGERKAFRDVLIKHRFDITSVQNGWITVRFIVNHVGLTDRFRFFCINQDYTSLQLSKNEKQELLKAVQSLQKWEVGKVDGKSVDSYYQITLKIENAKITDIF